MFNWGRGDVVHIPVRQENPIVKCDACRCLLYKNDASKRVQFNDGCMHDIYFCPADKPAWSNRRLVYLYEKKSMYTTGQRWEYFLDSVKCRKDGRLIKK